EDAGRQQGELVRRALADDGVAGVGAAVVADDEVVPVGEEVNDLALGLVAPLQADDTGATGGDAWRRRGRHGSDGRLRAAGAAPASRPGMVLSPVSHGRVRLGESSFGRPESP